jgi:hypothetical protein
VKSIPQRLKPGSFCGAYGTTKVVPFQICGAYGMTKQFAEKGSAQAELPESKHQWLKPGAHFAGFMPGLKPRPTASC